MAKLAKIYEKTIWSITIIVILFVLVVSGPKVLGIQPYVILSSSMEPTIQTGSLVYVNTKDKDVAAGDIVTYVIENENQVVTVTHRVLEQVSEGYVTKGDGNEVSDTGILKPEQIIGTYAAHIPQLGYFMERFNKKTILLAIAWMIGLHIFGFVLDNLVEDDDDQNTSEDPADEELQN